MITFSLRGVKVLHVCVRAYPGEVDRATMQLAEMTVDKAKQLVRVQTGRLQRSISMLRVEPRHYIVGSGVEYAGLVERGRGPIQAVRARALRFQVEDRVVFRRRVGPAKARPFMRPALEWVRGEASRVLQGILFSRRR